MKTLNFMKKMSWMLVIVALVTLSNCKEDETIVGNPPVADAGSAISASVGSSVTLNGSNSSDPDGDPLTYSWQLTQLPTGSSASVSGGTLPVATFIPDVEGTYTATLTVEDGNGNADSDDVVITVSAAVGTPPVAVITDDSDDEFSESNGNNVVSVNSAVILSGASSFDADSDPLSFEWSVSSAPAGSSATISNATSATAEFTPDAQGEFVISLTVDDGNGNTNTTTATITAEITPVIIDADITENTTWENVYDDPSYPDYRITASIDVDAELTVDPGVYVEVMDDRAITVNSGGFLNAVGTSTDSIKFTSANIAGGLHWVGILFISGHASNELTYTEVSYGGSDDIDYINAGWRTANVAIAENGKLSLKNSTFTNSTEEGLYVGGTLEAFESNAFIDNGSNAMALPLNQIGNIDGDTDVQNNGEEPYIRIYGSTLTENQSIASLKNDQSYLVSGDIDVEAELSISAGVNMAFNHDVFFRVNSVGSIIAEGTSSDPIIMTAYNIAAGLNWGGLEINSAYGTNKLDYVEIYYAGESEIFYQNSAWRTANLGITNDGEIAITNCIIGNGNGQGIYAGSSSFIDFANNEFIDNADDAVYIEFNEIGKIDANSSFSGNGVDGVTIYGSTLSDDQTITTLSNNAIYFFNGDVNINGALDVDAGARLHFDTEVLLTVNSTGSLNAIGTSTDIIEFTAANQASSFNWAGIIFLSNSSLNELQYAEISYAGSDDQALDYIDSGWRYANIGLNDATVIINDCTISNSDNEGIIIGSNSTLNTLTHMDTNPAATIESDNSFSTNASTDVLFLN